MLQGEDGALENQEDEDIAQTDEDRSDVQEDEDQIVDQDDEDQTVDQDDEDQTVDQDDEDRTVDLDEDLDVNRNGEDIAPTGEDQSDVQEDEDQAVDQDDDHVFPRLSLKSSKNTVLWSLKTNLQRVSSHKKLKKLSKKLPKSSVKNRSKLQNR